MKKFVFISIFILLVTFLFIYFSKESKNSTDRLSKYSLQDSTEKKEIRLFWKHFRKATKLRISGDWNKAADAYVKALKINPRHEDALYYLGNMYHEMEVFESALQTWEKLRKINPNSSRVWIQIGNLYLNANSGYFDIGKAETAFKEALEINKEETGPLIGLGKVYLFKSNLDSAETYFDAVIGSNYKSVAAHYLKGYIAWKKNNLKKALDFFTEAWGLVQPNDQKSRVIGEGDTKTGKTMERKNVNNLFNRHIDQLEKMNSEEISKMMKINYNSLDSALSKIK